jgi:translation initiation factor 3 subunit D
VSLASSVDIRPEWSVLEQIQLSALTKLSLDVGAPEELSACGTLQYFDKNLDRITPKTELQLRRLQKGRVPPSSASEDAVLRRLASTPAPPPAAPPAAADGTAAPAAPGATTRVFATDGVLAALMCAPRSVYSWDMVITRDGDNMWLDKRGDSSFDLVTVNETAQEQNNEDKESMNGVDKLSHEATAINAAFFTQATSVAGGKVKVLSEAEPSAGGGSGVAYRYRQWRLDASTLLLARCELHAALEYKGEELVCTVKALNEFDSKVSGMDWRQKIETQRGAVLATELKNNANKLAKWTCASLLSGADQMKIGYVSRVHPKDANAHVILAAQTYKPRDFAAQINLNINNMWGILKTVVDICKALPAGKYVLVKDPSKPLLRLYEVSSSAFAGDYSEEALDSLPAR